MGRVAGSTGFAIGGHARNVPLDALRGVAILLVIVHHAWWRFPDARGFAPVEAMAAIGWAGVDLFFGISGFLITAILLQSSGAGAIRAFFAKRFFRIVPIYALALLAFAVAARITGNDLAVLHRIWINALLLTAWFIPYFGENGVPYTITWSVSVEEFAYLLFGALAATGPRLLAKALPWLLLAALLVRVVSVSTHAFAPISLYYFAPGRIDAIAAGGILAAVGNSAVRRLIVPSWLPWIAWLAVVGACSVLKRESAIVATAGYSLVALASAWLVLCVANHPGGKHWRATLWLSRLGLVSYFAYLFHGFVIGALALYLPPVLAMRMGVAGIAVVVVGITYALGRISWRRFEFPLILAGRRVAARWEAPPR